ncbi:MAG: hypothetical protein J4428_03145 [Candidatus Aenigmarchaeota archaeon]|nr:hypothetical protein [Candidatus Aenigmarchaeota archaeon]
MAFVARVSLSDLYLPTRGYIHEAGLKDTFGTAEAAGNYLRRTILDNSDVLSPEGESYTFLIAAL